MLRLRNITLVAICAFAQLAYSTELRAQNIFDDEPVADDSENAKPATSKSKTADPDDEKKPVAKKKKRKGKKKKSKAAAAPAETATKVEIPEYTPEELARQSYNWAPENSTVNLVSEAPGIKPEARPAPAKPVAQAAADIPEPRPPGQGFKLPEIPLTQVLIVAGFVILFLIYRFRVGRQIKRKKY